MTILEAHKKEGPGWRSPAPLCNQIEITDWSEDAANEALEIFPFREGKQYGVVGSLG